MIDEGIKIIDRLIQLATYRERKSKEYFDVYVEPLYKDAEKIVSDYLKLFQKLIHKIKKGESEAEIIKWIEQRRVDHLPIRMKTKSLLKHCDSRYYNRERNRVGIDKFQDGILRVMRGGVSLVEPGHISDSGAHTVLDVLYAFMYGRYREEEQSEKERSEFYLKCARRQMEYIQEAWKDAMEGYAELKALNIKPN